MDARDKPGHDNCLFFSPNHSAAIRASESIGCTRAAQYLNSGIFPNGSRAGLVRMFAAFSLANLNHLFCQQTKGGPQDVSSIPLKDGVWQFVLVDRAKLDSAVFQRFTKMGHRVANRPGVIQTIKFSFRKPTESDGFTKEL